MPTDASKHRPATGGFNTQPINPPRRRKVSAAEIDRMEADAALVNQRRLRAEFLARDHARATRAAP